MRPIEEIDAIVIAGGPMDGGLAQLNLWKLFDRVFHGRSLLPTRKDYAALQHKDNQDGR